jgi:hypothetical protein
VAIELARNIDLYRDKSGRLVASQMRYDNIVGDFTEFLQRLGVASTPAIPHAKKGLMFDTVDPGDYFTRDQLDAINEKFAEEFQTFGYAQI